MSTDLTQPSLEQSATRTDLARRLLARVERLPALLGTIPLTTEVQLLKGELSRGHDVLRSAGETNFLSVVTQVESALACLTWKQYTPEVADTLREAFGAGTRQEAFTFTDYDTIRTLFRDRGVPSVPAIDLDVLESGDLDDWKSGRALPHHRKRLRPKKGRNRREFRERYEPTESHEEFANLP
jgi:hypothetical protein